MSIDQLNEQATVIRQELDELKKLIQEVAILEMQVIMKNNADNLCDTFAQVVNVKCKVEMDDGKLSKLIQKKIKEQLSVDNDVAAESAQTTEKQNPQQHRKLLTDLTQNSSWID